MATNMNHNQSSTSIHSPSKGVVTSKVSDEGNYSAKASVKSSTNAQSKSNSKADYSKNSVR